MKTTYYLLNYQNETAFYLGNGSWPNVFSLERFFLINKVNEEESLFKNTEELAKAIYDIALPNDFDNKSLSIIPLKNRIIEFAGLSISAFCPLQLVTAETYSAQFRTYPQVGSRYEEDKDKIPTVDEIKMYIAYEKVKLAMKNLYHTNNCTCDLCFAESALYCVPPELGINQALECLRGE